MGDGTNPADTPYNRKVNEVAWLLVRAWNDNHFRPVHPTEIATFADMARTVIDHYGFR